MADPWRDMWKERQGEADHIEDLLISAAADEQRNAPAEPAEEAGGPAEELIPYLQQLPDGVYHFVPIKDDEHAAFVIGEQVVFIASMPTDWACELIGWWNAYLDHGCSDSNEYLDGVLADLFDDLVHAINNGDIPNGQDHEHEDEEDEDEDV